MAYFFPGLEWANAYMQALNTDDEFARAGATWEGDLNFVIENVPGQEVNPVIYLDLWHGKCRGVGFTDESGMKPAAFRINASLANWKKVLNKQMGPIPAMVSGQLRVHGNLPYILRHVASAQAMVECAAHVPTEFPE